jgi:hypothetical protein
MRDEFAPPAARTAQIVTLVQADAEGHHAQCAHGIADIAQGEAEHVVGSLSYRDG